MKIFHPFCPHICEELWHKLGNKTFISLEKWPRADESKIDEKFDKQEEQVKKTVEDIGNILKILPPMSIPPAAICGDIRAF